jgi:hypothetical protein
MWVRFQARRVDIFRRKRWSRTLFVKRALCVMPASMQC